MNETVNKDVQSTETENGLCFSQRTDPQQLLAEQGIKPVTRFEDLLGDPLPDEEGKVDIDEFLEMLKGWRSEGGKS